MNEMYSSTLSDPSRYGSSRIPKMPSSAPLLEIIGVGFQDYRIDPSVTKLTMIKALKGTNANHRKITHFISSFLDPSIPEQK